MPVPKHLEMVIEVVGSIYYYQPSIEIIPLSMAIEFARQYAKDCQHDIMLVYDFHYLTIRHNTDIAEAIQRYHDRDQPGSTRGHGLK